MKWLSFYRRLNYNNSYPIYFSVCQAFGRFVYLCITIEIGMGFRGYFFSAILFLRCGVIYSQALDVAPNDIPVPWYSQKFAGCPYAHCSLASSLMVFDYYKGMTSGKQRSAGEAEEKLVEYQRNYFMKKNAPFKRRSSICKGGYLYFELDSLARYYENMNGAEFFQKKDYAVLKKYIDEGKPVLVNVRYRGSRLGLVPGTHGHWMVLRGITDTHVWVNDPGRSAEMREKADNICYPIRKQRGNSSYFDGCWTGKYIIITPKSCIQTDSLAGSGIFPPCQPAAVMPAVIRPRQVPPGIRSVTHK